MTPSIDGAAGRPPIRVGHVRGWGLASRSMCIIAIEVIRVHHQRDINQNISKHYPEDPRSTIRETSTKIYLLDLKHLEKNSV